MGLCAGGKKPALPNSAPMAKGYTQGRGQVSAPWKSVPAPIKQGGDGVGRQLERNAKHPLQSIARGDVKQITHSAFSLWNRVTNSGAF